MLLKTGGGGNDLTLGEHHYRDSRLYSRTYLNETKDKNEKRGYVLMRGLNTRLTGVDVDWAVSGNCP